MTEPAAVLQTETVRDRIIVALDVENAPAAREVMDELRGDVGGFKIGLQLFTAAGAAVVRDAVKSGAKIFLDLKFHDIPNTVASAAVEAARLGVWMFNVHALGGQEMMQRSADAVREVCEREGLSRPKIIAVTVLTSSNAETLKEVGVETPVENEVSRLAKLSAESGLDGVVASPHEISVVRETVAARNFMIVTPGIRPFNATNDDQKRVMTPAEAIAAGSDYLVIGRPIVQAKDRAGAVNEILANLGSDSQ
ncbi:MAG TPA: orotidine-5'-phosphate decarboxylase [Pyrinomonadaceae bacterium]|jgi:orotidine-5'-phosphate decarboxylase|nr:orotidine-5'-phosphate decarboxylase [Pyrinomonadaceae bacterium]